MKKRILSLLLIFSMVLSCVSVTSYAVDGNSLAVLSINKVDASTGKVGEEVDSVKNGDVIAVTVGVKAGTETIGIAGYQFQLNYDENVFEPWSQTTYDEGAFYKKIVSTDNIKRVIKNWGTPSIGKSEGNINLALTYSETVSDYTDLNYNVNANDSVALVQIAFVVKADAEKSTAKFEFDSGYSNKLIYYPKADESKTAELESKYEGASIYIDGRIPELKDIRLSDNSVTVNGADGATVTAAATSAQGTNLTDKVNWTVAPANSGVSIGNTGVITVAKNAKAGEYTITATGDDTTATGSANATLEVARAAETYTVTVTPAAAELTIPVGETNAETTYRAAVTNQYGETVKDPTVEWSLSEKATGVSIDNAGKVTVTAGAKDPITSSKQFTVTAKYGAAEGAASLTVKRAASVVKSMNLAASAGNPVIPADGTNMTVTLSISDVKDQYGADAVLNGNVEWTADIGGTRFAQNGNGGYTATLSTAEVLKAFGSERKDGVTVTFTAKCGDVQDSTQVKLTLAEAEAKTIVLTSSPAGEDIVIPTGDTLNTKTYTAAVKDQYGFPMSDKAALSMNPESAAGVSFDAETGKVSVSKDATADMVYTVTATCGTATASHTFTVKNKIMHADALSVMQSGFAYGESGKLAPSAALDGAVVEAAYSYTDSNSAAVDTPVNAGTYTVTARYETATDIYTGTKTFTIAPKALTAEMLTLSGEYTFNGNEQTVTYEVKDGKLLTPDDYAVIGINATNAGTYTVTVTGKGNYTGTVTKTWTITPAELTIESVALENRAYNGQKNVTVESVTFAGLQNGESLADYTATGMMDDANAGENKDVIVTVTLENAVKNYTLKNRVFESGKVTIAKASHEKVAANMEAKYGNTATLNLATLNLPAGCSFGKISTTDADSIFDGTPSIANSTLSAKLANGAAKAGKKATITIPVSSTNYADYTIEVTVTVLAKTAQTLKADVISVKYGDSFTPTVKDAKTDVTYEVKEGSESLLKIKDGKFVATGVGTAHIVASAAETNDYAAATKEITVKIAKRPLTVKADDKTAYVGAQQPELTYTVDGLVDGDELTTKPTLKLVHEAEADPMKTAGEYVITFDQAPAADAAKYDLVTADGKLTVSVRPVYVGPTGSPVEVGRSDNGTVTVSPANAAKGTTVTITANPGKGQELKSLEVLDQHGNSLPLTDLGNGKFSFVMPAGKVSIRSEFGEANAYVNPYGDVQPGDWYYSAVEYVTVNGLMNGTGKGFEPNLATSRAMIWTILARMSDVNTASSGEWYAVAQQWAIANGVSDGTMPNGTITREQLAAMLYRYAVSKGMVKGPATADLSVFADANSVSSYAVEAMQWAVSTGLIGGMDGKLNPQGSATRAQVATMLMRFAELAK